MISNRRQCLFSGDGSNTLSSRTVVEEFRSSYDLLPSAGTYDSEAIVSSRGIQKTSQFLIFSSSLKRTYDSEAIVSKRGTTKVRLKTALTFPRSLGNINF